MLLSRHKGDDFFRKKNMYIKDRCTNNHFFRANVNVRTTVQCKTFNVFLHSSTIELWINYDFNSRSLSFAFHEFVLTFLFHCFRQRESNYMFKYNFLTLSFVLLYKKHEHNCLEHIHIVNTSAKVNQYKEIEWICYSNFEIILVLTNSPFA